MYEIFKQYKLIILKIKKVITAVAKDGGKRKLTLLVMCKLMQPL